MERNHGTHQDRLIKKLRRRGISSCEAANHSGRKDLTPEMNVYAQRESRISGWPRTSNGNIGLADVIGKIDATILIGSRLLSNP